MYCYSAIFLTKNNLNLSYNLKRICESHNVNLIYEQDFSNLIYIQSNIVPNFIFIDISLLNENYNFKQMTNCFASKIAFVTPDIKLNNLDYECLTVEEIDQLLNICNDNNIIKQNLKLLDYGKQINNLLLSLGISPNHIGKDYLFECINLVLYDKKRFGCLNKNCYPVISLKYDTNSSNIERNIRHAIITAWSKKNSEKWSILLNGFDVSIKPSNREFICLCAEVIKMSMNQ